MYRPGRCVAGRRVHAGPAGLTNCLPGWLVPSGPVRDGNPTIRSQRTILRGSRFESLGLRCCLFSGCPDARFGGPTRSLELYTPPVLVPGTGSDHIWNAFNYHPALEDWRQMRAGLLGRGGIAWDLHGIDKHSGNVRLSVTEPCTPCKFAFALLGPIKSAGSAPRNVTVQPGCAYVLDRHSFQAPICASRETWLEAGVCSMAGAVVTDWPRQVGGSRLEHQPQASLEGPLLLQIAPEPPCARCLVRCRVRPLAS